MHSGELNTFIFRKSSNWVSSAFRNTFNCHRIWINSEYNLKRGNKILSPIVKWFYHKTRILGFSRAINAKETDWWRRDFPRIITTKGPLSPRLPNPKRLYCKSHDGQQKRKVPVHVHRGQLQLNVSGFRLSFGHFLNNFPSRTKLADNEYKIPVGSVETINEKEYNPYEHRNVEHPNS